MHHQPQLTLAQFNAQAMFQRNETQQLMETMFASEDHKFIHGKAREADVHGEEIKRKKALVKHNEARIQKRIEASEKRKVKAAQKAHRIAAITLEFDKEKINKHTGQNLKDHLLAFKQAGTCFKSLETAFEILSKLFQHWISCTAQSS